MSQLTDALNRIQAWLGNNYSVIAESINPGLRIEEIQQILQSIPFTLPHEVYELYQWSCGHNEDTLTNFTSIFDPFDGMSHCSLERAIEIQSGFDDEFEECAVKYNSKPLFPLFEFDGSYFCVIGDFQDKNSSPVIFVTDINEIIIKYNSLTSMMLTLAESFELGFFVLNDRENKEWNEEGFYQVYLKHNPDG